MSYEYKKYVLEDVLDRIFSGGTPNTQKKEYWNGDIPWLSSGETRNRIINHTEKYITEEGVANSSTKQALCGDVVIASAGQGYTRGQTSLLNLKTYINQSIIALRANEKILDNKYLFYNIASRYDELRAISDSASIRGSLTTTILKKLEIKLPPLSVQKKIANFLWRLDSKIELNNAILRNLEDTTATLFKQWFIKFEFPNEQGLPYLSNSGEMIDSELGSIPKDWSVKKLGMVATFKNGKKILDDKKTSDGKNKVYGSNGVIGFTDEVLQLTPSYVIGRVGANCGSVQFALQPCWITDNAIIGVPKDNKYYSYIYEVLKRAELRAKAGGSAQPLINQTVLNNISIIFPTENIINDFNQITYKILQMSDEIRIQNEKLSLVRDNLLSKVLSGKIEIPDESVVEPS